ncbi:Small RNA 2'-O-methyltransferase, partial [Coemansia sp. RSA 2399]
PDARFRDDDHKFEWTRAQFAAWAEQAAIRFGYAVELLPVGVKMRNAGADFVACGGCTQMAIFERKAGDEPAVDAQAETGCNVPVLLDAIEYPTYNRLLELVLNTVRSMNSSSSFTTVDLWAIPEIKRQFRLQSSLESWLRASSAHASSTLGRTRTRNGTIVYSISQP